MPEIVSPLATTFGFTPRGQYAGQGDGNGVIEGNNANGAGRNYGWVEGEGETLMFWADLTTANGLNVNLIDGSFSVASPTATPPSTVSGTAIANYFPVAKLGGGNYFYVYNAHNGGNGRGSPVNLFGMSAVASVASGYPGGCEWCLASNPGLTVQQAYSIDTKIDDGKPASGNVIAQYVDAVAFVGIGNASNAASPSSTTCYDTTSGNYSITVSNVSNVNCGISFRMQAGD